MLRTDATKLSYTPVNAETFKVWCDIYKEKLRLEREKTKTVHDDKPTGKEMFMQNRAAFDDIVLDATIDAEEENGTDAVEEEKSDEDEDEEFVYDRALYDADGLEDEDIDFDDWFHYNFVTANHNSCIKLA